MSSVTKFMPLASEVAKLSKDPRTKVGALIIDERRSVRAQGYNGFPRGVKDDPSRYEDRQMKLMLVAHAEANTIANAAAVGVPLLNCTLIVTKFPCHECAKLIINAGIRRVVTPPIDCRSDWVLSNSMAEQMFSEAGVQVEIYKEHVHG